jgi:hypothetical protein
MMKMILILLTAIIASACSERGKHRVNTGYHPQIGDHFEVVLSTLMSPYFSHSGPMGGEIAGYLYDPDDGRYSGFGTDMIDETKEGLKVVILYLRNNIVRDIVVLDGGVTGELLNGAAREIFAARLERNASIKESPDH